MGCNIGKWGLTKMSFLKINISESFSSALMKKLEQAGPRAAHALANQIAKDTEDFVPALTESLSNRTRVVENKIIYPGPYARYLYNGKVMVDAETGKGPMRIVSKDGSEVIRFRKGATLKPTERPLKIQQSVHKHATDHWFEASSAKNMDKWEEVSERLVKKYLSE